MPLTARPEVPLAVIGALTVSVFDERLLSTRFVLAVAVWRAPSPAAAPIVTAPEPVASMMPLVCRVVVAVATVAGAALFCRIVFTVVVVAPRVSGPAVPALLMRTLVVAPVAIVPPCAATSVNGAV